MLTRVLQGFLIGLAAGLLALAIRPLSCVERIEAKTWDLRAAYFCRREKPSDRITLVFLDQASLDWASKVQKWPWPWPREGYTPILDACRKNGTRAFAFDMVLTEPSLHGVEDDDALGAAAGAAGQFVGVVFLGAETGAATNWPAEIPRSPLKVAGLDAWMAEPRGNLVLSRASFPIPEVATNAALLANVFANPDPDGIYRRVRLFQVFDGQVVPSLGLAAYLAGAPDKTLSIRDGVLHAGSARIPLDREGRALLRFRGPSQTHTTLSAAFAIESALSAKPEKAERLASLLKDRYVFFGPTAPGLYDLKSSPVSGIYPGVEIHATVLDNLLANDFMRDAPLTMTVAVILLLAILAGVLARVSRNATQTVLAFVVLVPVPVLAGFGAYQQGLWLPIVAPFTAVVFSLTLGLVVNYATEGRQKRFIKNAFQQYLSPTVIEELVQKPDRLSLGGETRELSIYFSDIQGFTTISEGMTPDHLTAFMNEFLTAMTDIIQEQGGTVDKYIGDAIVAFWNAPLPQSDHAARAVRSALLGQRKLAYLRPHFRETTGRDIYSRIGLNTGLVVVGNMGSAQRFNYTFLGDAGNLASRLEGINKQFGTYVCVSETMRRLLPDEFAARELARVAVVGRKEPVVVYDPLFAEDFARQKDLFETFAKALSLFYGGRFAEAQGLFESIAGQDPPSGKYAERCRKLIEHPPAEWTGVLVMTEK